jgi:hypothetical protein
MLLYAMHHEAIRCVGFPAFIEAPSESCRCKGYRFIRACKDPRLSEPTISWMS